MRGAKIKGMLGGTMNVIGGAGMFSGLFSEDPDSWINAFGYGEPEGATSKKTGETLTSTLK